MKAGKQHLRWASGIMVVLGAGHLLLFALISRETIISWADRGLWAAVPLSPTTAANQTVESLRNQDAFWAGPGSFAVPLILLGCLIWHFAGRGVAIPAWLGWALMVWCFIGGVLLQPSPYFAGIIPSTLIILARRNKHFRSHERRSKIIKGHESIHKVRRNAL